MAGKYQPNFGAAAASECIDCPAGYYCSSVGLDAPSGQCTAGFFCDGGKTTPTPATAICAIGYYCPTGSVQQILCAEADYQSLTRQASCTACPTGSYCFESNSPVSWEAGNYCPGSNRKKACFPGKYGDTTGQSTEATGCKTCPAGKAWELFGTTTNYKICKGGYYCATGSISSIPQSALQGGLRCTKGNYCPEGSSSLTTCPAGKYWDRTGLAEPTGNCEAGYYCTGGTTQQNPTTSGGNVCPAGKYCPEGTSTPISCPVGTYRDYQGGSVLADWYACPDGRYCQTTGLTSYTNNCAAGYYCPAGQTNNNPVSYQCPAGSYCPAGSMIAKKCAVGYYQPNVGQAACLDCPAGSYWDGTDTSTYIACVIGYYCPLNTRYATEYPCPEGTYGDTVSNTQSSDCKPWPAGYYCDQKGQTAYSKKILAGYYSTSTGQIIAKPSDVSNVKGRCETGNYCPEGSSSLTPCPAGTYNDGRGSTSLSDCQPCPPGKYCNAAGKTYAELQGMSSTYYGTCSGGYVCIKASTTSTPNDNVMGKICPRGYYWTAGTVTEVECATGYYAPNQGQASCTDCPTGEYCSETGLSSTYTCTNGNYCPIRSVLPTPCSPGLYNTNTGSTSSAACQSCPAGLYCSEEGLSNYNAQSKCAAGYLCTGGSDTPYPVETANRSNNNRKCPLGYSCSQSATTPSICTTGTFQNSYGSSSCKSCPPGYYCNTNGLSDLSSRLCSAGYICYGGATTSTPSDGTTGDVCPIGSKCEAGSAKALAWEDGKKTTTTTNSVCNPCTAGTYCIASVEYDCPTRRYCPAGSVRGVLCDAGTYNDASTKLTAASSCLAWPERVYCIDGTKGSDFCESGHICGSGSGTPLPTGDKALGAVNYICPKGRYCLKAGASGLNAPTDCSASKYTYYAGSDSLDDCLSCAAGYYCPTGQYDPQTCPAGSYCVSGSTAAVQCPINTVRITTNGEYERAWARCPQGSFWNTVGLGTLTGKYRSAIYAIFVSLSISFSCNLNRSGLQCWSFLSNWNSRRGQL